MIIKILTRHQPSFHQLLDYILENKERLYDSSNKTFTITHNIKGDKIEDWVRQYKENEGYRRIKKNNSVILSHEVISFHKDDNVSLEQLEDIARKYIELRNPSGMYVIAPHFDKQFHLHICTSGLGYKTGKSLRMSKTEFGNLKKQMQGYQIEKYPHLSKSIVAHGKSEKKDKALSDREYQIKRRTGRATHKEQVIGVLKNCYKKSNCKDDFFEMLKESGLQTYIRGGKIYGVNYENRKYRFKTLGFTEERLNELDIWVKRNKELGRLRKFKKGKLLER